MQSKAAYEPNLELDTEFLMYVQISRQNFLYQFNFNNDDKKAENTHVSIINSIRVLTFFFTNTTWLGPTHLKTTPNDP